jgi:hypothetical protein
MTELTAQDQAYPASRGNCPKQKMLFLEFIFWEEAKPVNLSHSSDWGITAKKAIISQGKRKGIMSCQANKKQWGCDYKESIGKIPGSQTLFFLNSLYNPLSVLPLLPGLPTPSHNPHLPHPPTPIFISRHSIRSHWSNCLFLYQYHAVFITIAWSQGWWYLQMVTPFIVLSF